MSPFPYSLAPSPQIPNAKHFPPRAGLVLKPLHRCLAVADPDHFEFALTVILLDEQAVSAAQVMFDAGDQCATHTQAASHGILGEEFAVGVYACDANLNLGRDAGLSSAFHLYDDH